MKFLSATIVMLLSATSMNEAFSPALMKQRTALTYNNGKSSRTRMYSTVDDTTKMEKQLRKQIKARNSVIADEGKYAVADGERLSAGLENEVNGKDMPVEATVEATHEVQEIDPLAATIERMTKPRAYPLFVAEKTVELLEGIIDDFVRSFSGGKNPASLSLSPPTGTRERIVILGTGWGAASFLTEIDASLYDVTVISPRNYFLFTPMLAGTSVGTVEFRSITEPIRHLNGAATYMEATANSVDTVAKTVTCESVACRGNSCNIEEFTIEYDRLLVTVGAQTNTFGIPGVREYCFYLKQVEDARKIRTAIVNCFERANLPHLGDEERIRNLTFAVIGAGPSGIEFASELRDFIEQDGPKFYPKLLKYVRIKIIEASGTILAPFDKSLQDEAIAQMSKQVKVKNPAVAKLLPERFKLIELLLDSSVKEVTEKTIFLNDGTSLDYGLSVWAAGNGPLPFTLDLIKKLGDEQAKEQSVARGRIATDPWMRAYGGGGSVLALGDCTCITQSVLPATAQVASQQGGYLAKLLNKKYDFSPAVTDTGIFPPPSQKAGSESKSLSDAIASFATQSSEYAKPFQFLNLGILAYTGGGSALAQVSAAPNTEPLKGKGRFGNVVWKTVYLSKQFSMRNRLLVLNDWQKRRIFGRDITQL